jgi:hypothetical protein
LVLLGCVLPGIAWGAEVRLSASGAAEYDDNVFRNDTDRQDDIVFRLTPRVSLVEDRDEFNYSVGYALPFEIGVKSDLRDLNHLGDASFRYRLTPQTELFGNDGFYYVRGLYRQEQDLSDPSLGAVGDGRERVLQNNVTLGATHFFSPRLSGTLRLNQGIFDTTQFNRANTLNFGGTASGGYQLTPHHQLGGGLGYSRQSFDNTFDRPASDTDYYNLFGTWQWLFDETTTFEIQLGPALIHSSQDKPPPTRANQLSVPYLVVTRDPSGDPASITVGEFDTSPETCPMQAGNRLLIDSGGRSCVQRLITNPGQIMNITGQPLTALSFATPPEAVDDTRITYFASTSLTKRWSPTLASSLAYSRRDDTASGIDGGATLDALILTTSWRITERWDLSVRGDWTQRQSATNGGRVFVTAVDSGVATIDSGGFAFTAAGAGNLVQIDSADSLDTQRWGTAVRLAHRLTKNTVTALQYAYNKQSSNGNTVGFSSDFDNHLLTFSVQYNFEPIGLWW